MVANRGRGTSEVSRRVPEPPESDSLEELQRYLKELTRYLQNIAWEEDFAGPESIGVSKLMKSSITLDRLAENVLKAENIDFSTIPTSSTGLSSGDIWNDNGTLKIV